MRTYMKECTYSGSFHASLIVENDSSNAITWILQKDNIPWKLQYFFNEIRWLSSLIQAVYRHVKFG